MGGLFYLHNYFTMQNFFPNHIYLDPAVRDLPVTRRILQKYPNLPVTEVSDRRDIKQPIQHSHAKKQLYITKHQGQVVKSCQGMGDYVCCHYYTMALVTDCHLECTYCILQDYLQNNPVITMYANLDEIFNEVSEKVTKHPDKLFRIGTGELSDSLALDHITEFSRDLCSLVDKHENLIIELKTKTANVANLLDMEASDRLVISWSINPETYVAAEEHKCDTLADRLKAARVCADHGYKIGFHLDPLLYYDDWQEKYRELIDELAKDFDHQSVAWISVGSLRFTPGLKKISAERFPKSKLMTGELYPSADGKMRYFRPLREEMYAFITQHLKDKLSIVPQYLCMETKPVWESVYGEIPKNNSELEQRLTQNFRDGGSVYTLDSISENLSCFEV